jgi:methylmalonyl-CoA carboxyltransferase small subunit
LKLQITIDGRVYVAQVELLEEEEESPRLPSYAPYSTPAPAAGTRGLSHAGSTFGDDAKVCQSPVTGLVIRVNVEAGQAVEANRLVMVLEAMKMETNVMAPCAGTVKSVRVTAGDPVKVGQILVEFA